MSEKITLTLFQGYHGTNRKISIDPSTVYMVDEEMLVDYRNVKFDMIGAAACKITFIDKSYIWCEDGAPDGSGRWIKKAITDSGVTLVVWVNPPDNYRPKKPKSTKKRRGRAAMGFGSD